MSDVLPAHIVNGMGNYPQVHMQTGNVSLPWSRRHAPNGRVWEEHQGIF